MRPPKPSDSIELAPGKAPMGARTVTLAQLAKRAGVSPSAASVVLNNNSNSSIKVSEETRQRILDAARELNYQPNALARSLINRQTNVIGLCSTLTHMIEPMHPFLGALLEGMLLGCRNHEKNLMMYSRVATVSDNDLYLEVLNGQLDGLVLFAHESSSFTQRLAESNLPVVTVADKVSGLPCVGVDDELGGRLLARYLAEKGHRRALYWAPHHDLSSSMETRMVSYLEEAHRCGLHVEVMREQHPFEEVLERVVRKPKPPTVISVYCDFVAVGIINSLKTIGLRVPQDVAVTGFDGVPGSYPTLTSVRAPWKEVAQTAVSLLAQQCQGKAIPMHTTMPIELVASESA